MPSEAERPLARASGLRSVLRWGPFWAVLLAGSAFSWLAFTTASQIDDARIHGVLELQAEWRARDFERKIGIAAAPVEALVPFISAQDDIDPALFHRFASQAHDPADATEAVIWAPLVKAADRQSFVDLVRNTGSPNFDIVERAPDGGTVPAGERGEYLPVWLDETFGRKLNAPSGFDLLSIPERRGWAEMARDSGEPTATPYTPIFPGPRSASSYVVYAPIYAGGRPPATIAQRHAAFRGLAIGRFSVPALLMNAIAGTPEITERIDFFIDSDSPGAVRQLVARYDPQARAFDLAASPSRAQPGDVEFTRSFDIFGRNWMLLSRFPATQAASLRSSAPWSWLTLSLLLTLLCATYITREHWRRLGVEAMVAERTADLTHAMTALRNETAERRRAEQQLIQAQKMEAIGNLTGGLAHDFNNLLGVIIGNLDLLRESGHQDEEAEELVGDALEAARRGADLTRRLLAFARRQPLRPHPIAPNDLVAGTVRLLSRTLGESIEITLDLAPDVWVVLADPAQLEASLANLATNARDAMPNGGKLNFATANVHLDADYVAQHPDVREGDYARIEVSDTGAGMTAEVMSHIFEPFYTTKGPAKGTGLGLSMVFGFLKQSGGHISVYSEEGVGTTFRLYLPHAAEQVATADTGETEGPARGHGERVLVVEDDAALRRVVLRQLRDLGYHALEAENGAAALAILEQQGADLVFTDVIMPGEIDGYDLAHRVIARWPATKVILTSGFPQAKVNGDFGGAPEFRLLTKPYRRAELAAALRAALDG